MKRRFRALCAGLLGLVAITLHAQEPRSWTQPVRPFRIYGNTWYVGTQGLGAILITSPQGHVLIDGTLPENAAQIERNIRALGFRLRDVRVILNSHPHADHAGAIAQLARDSGARVRATAAAAAPLQAGGRDPADPQYGEAPAFPAVGAVEPVRNGEVVRLGPLALTAHATPGHTPGSMSWTWRSCEQHACLDIAYVDSLTAIARKGFRFGDDPARMAAFRTTFTTVAGLPCDVLITPHPDASDFMARVQRHALIDRQACKAYAEAARERFERRLAEERTSTR
ncbi:subclass B3 metallo-beta-lactamase [Fulvimonas yonginensis]|uniref:Subclass B3 metallo-beta-lactamase n=1 Tax=Fulvimonas yonginensis TaxID=1495200 RepID=A0ABU8JGH4_9GAMM